jgi:hypothetical protein
MFTISGAVRDHRAVERRPADVLHPPRRRDYRCDEYGDYLFAHPG